MLHGVNQNALLAVALIGTGLVVACSGNVVVDPPATHTTTPSTTESGSTSPSATTGSTSTGVNPSTTSGFGGSSIVGPGVGGSVVISGSVTSGGGSCTTTPPLSSLMNCGASAVSTGGGMSCQGNYCQQNGDTWTSSCVNGTCACILNGSIVCTCFQPSGFCNDSCCFH